MKGSDPNAQTTIRLFVARLPHDTTLEEVCTLFDDTPGITDIAIRRTSKPDSWMSKDTFVQQVRSFPQPPFFPSPLCDFTQLPSAPSPFSPTRHCLHLTHTAYRLH